MEFHNLKGRAEVTGEVGDQLDKLLHAAEAEVQVQQGKFLGLSDGAAAVAKLHEHVRRDMEENKLPLTFETQIQAASYVNRWITRAAEILSNLAQKAKSEELVAHGKVASARQSLEVVQRYHTSAVARAKQLLAPPDPEPVEPEDTAKTRRKRRKAGEHPGGSPLDERRAAARKAAKKKG